MPLKIHIRLYLHRFVSDIIVYTTYDTCDRLRWMRCDVVQQISMIVRSNIPSDSFKSNFSLKLVTARLTVTAYSGSHGSNFIKKMWRAYRQNVNV